MATVPSRIGEHVTYADPNLHSEHGTLEAIGWPTKRGGNCLVRWDSCPNVVCEEWLDNLECLDVIPQECQKSSAMGITFRDLQIGDTFTFSSNPLDHTPSLTYTKASEYEYTSQKHSGHRPKGPSKTLRHTIGSRLSLVYHANATPQAKD